MLESLKKILKVYPLPIFVLLLTFVAYYSAFEFLKKKEPTQDPISQEESMQNIAESPQETKQEIPKEIQVQANQTITVITEAPLTAPQQLPEPKPIIYLTSNVESLNVRKGTNTQSPIVGKFTPTQVAISLEEKEGWVLLADTNTKEPIGWVLKRFVKEVEAQQNMESKMDLLATETIAPKTQNIPQIETSQNEALYASRVPSLNIRENPNTEARILNKLTPNDAVRIIETDGIWVKIQDSTASGKNGWVVRRSLVLRD